MLVQRLRSLLNVSFFLEFCDLVILVSDIYELPRNEKCFSVLKRFQTHFYVSQSLILSIFKTMGFNVILMLILTFISKLLHYPGLFLLKAILKYFEQPDPQQSASPLYLYAIAFFITLLLRNLLDRKMDMVGLKNMIRSFNSLYGIVYRKTLTLSIPSKNLSETGKIINIFTGDVPHISHFSHHMTHVLFIPFQIVMSLIFLTQEFGWYGFLLLVSPLICTLFHKIVIGKIILLHEDLDLLNDKKTKYLNEYLDGIRILKYNAWEPFAIENIKKVREQEQKLLLKVRFLYKLNELTWHFNPILMILFMVGTYCLNNPLTASSMFTAMSLIDMIRVRIPITLINLIF
jgi:ABC-type multidrug transport system fused ATPase/permease subunit